MIVSAIRAGDKWQDAIVEDEPKILAPVNFQHKAGDGVGTRERKLTDTVPAIQARAGATQGSYVTIHNVYGGFKEEKPRVFEEYSPTIRTPAGGGHIPMVAKVWGAHSKANIKDRVQPADEAWCLDGSRNNVVGTITEAVGTRQGSSKEFLSSVDTIAREIGQVRRLTPIECERLQGFPDDWTKCAGISDTQRYKMLGNAVTVNVIQAIAERWLVRNRM